MSDVEARLERHRQRESRLSALLDVVRELAMSADLDSSLKILARRARLLLGMDMSFVILTDDQGRARVRAADGNVSELGAANDHTTVGATVDDVVGDEDLRAVLSAPLTHGMDTIGTLYVADRDVRRFTADEISLLNTLGDLAGATVEKTRLLARTNAVVATLRARLGHTDARVNALRELTGARDRLIDLVLAGGDLHTLAEEASAMLHGAVRIVAIDNTVLSSAGKVPEDEDSAAATVDTHVAGAPVSLDGDLWAVPVLAGEENLGTLTVRPRDRLAEADEARLHAIAQTAALLLRDNRFAGTDNRAREVLLDEFLNDPAHSPQSLGRRAGRLGIDLDTPHIVVLVRAEEIGEGRAAYWSSSFTYRKNGLRSIRDDHVVLLVPGTDPGAVADEVRAELSRLLGHPATVAISQPAPNAGAIAHAYQEAARYLDAMAALGITGSAVSAHDLGFLGLLLSDHHDVDGFVRATIGPVLDYDEQCNTELVSTLEAYFNTGSSPTYAAEKLHVHPNTVTRRLDRIGELLDQDWQKPERVLDIQVALRLSRIRHVLRTRPLAGSGEHH